MLENSVFEISIIDEDTNVILIWKKNLHLMCVPSTEAAETRRNYCA